MARTLPGVRCSYFCKKILSQKTKKYFHIKKDFCKKNTSAFLPIKMSSWLPLQAHFTKAEVEFILKKRPEMAEKKNWRDL